MAIEIKSDVPVPQRRHAGGRPIEYPFDDLKAGQHFDVLPRDGESLDQCVKRCRTAASSWRRRKGPIMSFVIRDRDDFGFNLRDAFDREVVRVWAVLPEHSTAPRAVAARRAQD